MADNQEANPTTEALLMKIRQLEEQNKRLASACASLAQKARMVAADSEVYLEWAGLEMRGRK